MVFVINSHGGHLGHVTWTTGTLLSINLKIQKKKQHTNLGSPFQWVLHMKFGLDFREEDV